jgi:hypothetical protein
MRALLSLSAFLLVCMFPLAARADDKDDAEAVLRAYLAALARQLPVHDPVALSKYDGGLMKLQELGEKHLLKNKDVLHKKAAADYLRLPLWKPDTGSKLAAIHKDDLALKHLVEMFRETGYGIDRRSWEYRTTLWWEPDVAAKAVRQQAQRRILDHSDMIDKEVFERFATPRMYREGEDPEHPDIAFFDGTELFVVHLVYTKVGIYAVEPRRGGIEWYLVSLMK